MMDASDTRTSVAELERQVRDLTHDVRRLRQDVDELREIVCAEAPHWQREPLDIETAPAATPPLRLKSMPLDPCDPEFGQKINAVETSDERPESTAPRPATLNEFVAWLKADPPADRITCDEWTEGRMVDSGVVLEVDDDLFDWFGDHFDVEYEAPDCSYVLAGDNGGEYVLWSTAGEVFLRQLTEEEAETFAELMRVAEEQAALKREQFRNPDSPQKQQGCLW